VWGKKNRSLQDGGGQEKQAEVGGQENEATRVGSMRGRRGRVVYAVDGDDTVSCVLLEGMRACVIRVEGRSARRARSKASWERKGKGKKGGLYASSAS